MNGICQEKPRVGHWLHRYRFTAIAAVAALVVLVGARVTWNTPSGKSGAAADHMENAAAAEMEVAEDALEPQEAPQMAAFQEAPAEPAAEVAAEEPALQPAENPDGGQNFGADASLKEETVYSSEENAPSFPECIKALQEAGYSGHVMYLTDVSREKLEQVVPDMREIALEDGLVAYEIGESDAAVVQTRFPVSEDRVSGTDSEEHYFIFLVS